jgi:hypothetical protein
MFSYDSSVIWSQTWFIKTSSICAHRGARVKTRKQCFGRRLPPFIVRRMSAAAAAFSGDKLPFEVQDSRLFTAISN